MADFEDDKGSNDSNNEAFQDVLDARLSRRGFLGGSLTAAAGITLGGASALLKSVPVSALSRPHRRLLGFQAIPVSTADTVVVPEGYTAEVLIAWGDPVGDGPEFAQDGSNSADEQASSGACTTTAWCTSPSTDHDTGCWRRTTSTPTKGCCFLMASRTGTRKRRTSRSMRTVCLSSKSSEVIIISHRRRWRSRGSKKNSDWHVVQHSRYARRITGQTPIRIGGPAAGDDRLKTIDDPTGTTVLGTLNNCAMGFTPWGTYLTCEENFHGFFFRTLSPDSRSKEEKRYGIGPSNGGFRWYQTHPRFNADTYPNEANRFGWVVEIDPFDPHSTPVKRTALGRLKHEGAWVQETKTGRIVVYMGDDERNEYIYRYVSRLPWKVARRRGINPLDDGILYVAKFNADGKGEWLPLTPDYPALVTWTLNDILINTRGAADAVGATMMDRPEWIDTFPQALTAVATLTNNNRRGTNPPSSNNPDGTTTAGSARPPVDAINSRTNNVYGHIITWTYDHDFDEPDFSWDVFALAGDPAVPAHGSTIIGDKFGSPDGLFVAPSGRLWIQTDVSTGSLNTGDYAGFGNNQMLCADPTTGEIRRFLTGPKQCEIDWRDDDARREDDVRRHPASRASLPICRAARTSATTRRLRSCTARGPTSTRAVAHVRRAS